MDEYDDRFQDVSDLFQGLGQVVRYIVFGYFKMLGDLFVGKVLLPAHLKNFPTHRRHVFYSQLDQQLPLLSNQDILGRQMLFVVGITLLLIPLKNFLTLEQINDRIAGNRVKQGLIFLAGSSSARLSQRTIKTFCTISSASSRDRNSLYRKFSMGPR